MTIRYTEKSMLFTDDGFYLVKVDGELTVAEWNNGTWSQIGADYDVWEHSYGTTFDVEVICRLDLGQIATEVEAHSKENPNRIAVIFDIANGFQNTPVQWFAETVRNRMVDSIGLNGKTFEVIDLRAKK